MTYSRDEEAFEAELVELCKKHGFVICGCGCCGSPWIGPIEEASKYGESIPSSQELGLGNTDALEEEVFTFSWDQNEPT